MKRAFFALLSTASLFAFSVNADSYNSYVEYDVDPSQGTVQEEGVYYQTYQNSTPSYSGNQGQRYYQNSSQNYSNQNYGQQYYNQGQRYANQGYNNAQRYANQNPNSYQAEGYYTGQSQPNQAYSNSNTRPASYGQNFPQSDKAIVDAIRFKLQDNSANRNKNVVARVVNGTVVLTGFVSSQQDRQNIESNIKSISGIRNVDNKLEVRDNTTADHNDYNNNPNAQALEPKDQEISKEVNDLIKPGFFSKGYPNVNFKVIRGVVILLGSVDKDVDAKDLAEKVQKINGVQNVDNQLNVQDARDSANLQNLSAKDQEIDKKIQDAIKPGYFSKGYPNVSFRVNNGNVVLLGFVENERDAKDLAEKVQKFDGVTRVDNQLLVQDARANQTSFNDSTVVPASEKTDQEITLKIQKLLAAGMFSKGFPNVDAKVNNGTVTLIGTVEKENDKRELTEKAQKIEGVKRVDNQIIVQQPSHA